jgi:hypothetical protein
VVGSWLTCGRDEIFAKKEKAVRDDLILEPEQQEGLTNDK